MKAHGAKPKATLLVDRLLYSFQEFVHANVSSGIILIVCTVTALFWANSPWAESYYHLWESHFAISFPGLVVDKPLYWWINDGLMTIFFLLVGLEIKRELLVGELSRMRQAILPMIAALGGVTFPALIYSAFNWGTVASSGWGIPMATDIAFALGVLALLGNQIPLPLKVFLSALAIVDDLIAVLVIAFFYSTGINWVALAWSGGIFLGLVFCNALGIRHIWVYILVGILLWFAISQSGIHATIAGVLLAIAIPARARIDAPTFLHRGRELLDEFDRGDTLGTGLVTDDQQQTAVHTLETLCKQLQAPLQRIEHALYLPVFFIIVPLFILANAGISLSGQALSSVLLSRVSLGVFLGLIIGKQLGITLCSWLAVKLGWAELPQDVLWRHIYGVSWLGAIGFTMSLFIGDLAFGATHQELLNQAKVGILLALLLATGIGYLLLSTGGHKERCEQPI